jgi:hypothetical protein
VWPVASPAAFRAASTAPSFISANGPTRIAEDVCTPPRSALYRAVA